MTGLWDAGNSSLDYTIVGNWNANTNSPNLDVVSTIGNAYIVSTAGTHTLGTISNWNVNDVALKISTGWAILSNRFSLVTNYLYVGKHGSDTAGNGSVEKPFLTIQKAISVATAGTTIFVWPGAYTENLALKAGVNLVAPAKFSVTVIGTASTGITGTVYLEKIIFRNSTGYALNFSGTTAQNIQALMCNFESATGNGYDAVNYSNSNASSKLFMTDSVVTTYTSTTAKALNVVAGSAGSIIMANTTVQLVDNPNHVAIYLGGSVSYTHTMDAIIGQVVTANTSHFTAAMLTVTTLSVPTLVHNSTFTMPSMLSSIVTTTTSTPAITGSGLLTYAAAFYAGTGSGGAATLNNGLGPLPFDMASIKFRTQAGLLPNTALALGYLNGVLEFTSSGLYFSIGTTRYKLSMTAV